MKFMNFFGNQGSFDHILEILETAEITEELTFKILVHLFLVIAKPSVTYHKQFVEDFGQRIVTAIRKHLEGVKTAQMIDVDKIFLTDILFAYGDMLKLTGSKEQEAQETQRLQLALCLKLMQSESLDAKKNGISTLNDALGEIIAQKDDKSNSGAFVVDWINENKVLDIMLDP